MSNNIYTCKICNKQFSTPSGIRGHNRIHGPSSGHSFYPRCCIIETKQEIMVHLVDDKLKEIDEYNLNPNRCKWCNKIIPFEHRTRKFCCRSHGTSYQNKMSPPKMSRKGKESIARKNSERATLRPKSEAALKKLRQKQALIPCGPCSPVHFIRCKHCQKIFTSRKLLKYCSCCSYLYSKYNRNRFKFIFGISNYPDLFDIELIKLLGFYAPGGKSGNWNPNGLSRDHKVSVNEAIKNNYDPYYITHPCNCELMTQKQNNKKKTRSSITYEELVILVDDYDNKIKSLVAPEVRLERTVACAEN